MANVMRMNNSISIIPKYLFKNGAFIQQPTSNTFKISGGNLINGDNTTSCKWTDLNDKIKFFVLIGKYRDIDGNIRIASSGFTPTFKTINIQTSWNSEYQENESGGLPYSRLNPIKVHLESEVYY